MKRLLTNLKIKIIAFLGAGLLNLIYLSLRIKSVKLPNDAALKQALSKPCVLLFWHGQQLFGPLFKRKILRAYPARKDYVLISQHTDGRIIAEICQYFSIDSVAGSSTRGGIQALAKLARSMKDGARVSITPDGPKGPVYKIKAGALKLAQLAEAPIVPFAMTTDNTWRFSSWDRMTLPKPFSKVYIHVGQPIYVKRDLSEEEFSLVLTEAENSLNFLTNSVDQDANNL